MKTIFASCVVGVALVGLTTACTTSYVGSEQPNGTDTPRPTATPQGETEYQFVSYDILINTVEIQLGVPEIDFPGDPTNGIPASPNNPQEDPLGFLKARADSIGAPVFDPANPNQSLPGKFGPAGMKNWTLAINGACYLAFADGSTPTLTYFAPASAGHRYDAFYTGFVGRKPTPAEVDELDALWTTANWANDRERRTAVCTAVLGSLEYLGIN